MKYSELFGGTERELPRNYREKGQGFLIQAGMMSGLTGEGRVFLPLGVKTRDRLKDFLLSSQGELEVQEVEVTRGEEGGAPGEASFVNLLVETLRTNVSSYRDLPVALGEKDLATGEGDSLLEGREDRVMELFFACERGEREDYLNSIEASLSESFSRLDLETFRHRFPNEEEDENTSERIFLCVTGMGPEVYFRCGNCEYSDPKPLASSELEAENSSEEEVRELEKLHGPEIVSVKKLADFAEIPVEKTTKTMVFETEETGRLIAAAVGGDREISEEKLRNLLGEDFYLAPPMTVREALGTDPGYVGVVDLPEEVELIPDLTMKGRTNFECGANEEDYHLLNVNFGRDLPEPDRFYDIRQVQEGERCPLCGEGELYSLKAAKISSSYPLEDSDQFDLNYTDARGEQKSAKLWRSRIFLSRLFACVLEKNRDEDGLVWPEALAPFSAHLISLGEEKEIEEKAEGLYRKLLEEDIDVLWDERNCKAGVKFNDADLLGMPVRLVVGKKSLERGAVEYKRRDREENVFLSEEEIIKRLKGLTGRES